MTLDLIGRKYRTDKSSLEHDFLNFYEKNLFPLKEQRIRLLEIGIGGTLHSRANKSLGGDSLRTWAEYFPFAEIYGVDIDKNCLRYKYDSDRVHTLIGDQTNRKFLDSIPGEFDIIIDDGSHIVSQQIISFGFFFQTKLKDNGIYIIEDLHTSYKKIYGGNPQNVKTTLSFLQKLQDNQFEDNNFLLPQEKEFIKSHVKEIIIHGDSIHCTSIIRKNGKDC